MRTDRRAGGLSGKVAKKAAHPRAVRPQREHSVPWFWPLAAAIEMEEQGLALFRRNLEYLEQAGKLALPPPPEWASPNRMVLELDTMRSREFPPPQANRRGRAWSRRCSRPGFRGCS